MITSVAALMSPGFTVGQPLPMGYDVYNVPYAYRATYYDTPNAWYRYNNGYIYQVDPMTQLVTADRRVAADLRRHDKWPGRGTQSAPGHFVSRTKEGGSA